MISYTSQPRPPSSARANLDEHGQTVVGVASRVQVVLVFLGDVWHQHVHQSLHRVVEGCREALVPGELGDPDKMKKKRRGYARMEALKEEERRAKNNLL